MSAEPIMTAKVTVVPKAPGFMKTVIAFKTVMFLEATMLAEPAMAVAAKTRIDHISGGILHVKHCADLTGCRTKPDTGAGLRTQTVDRGRTDHGTGRDHPGPGSTVDGRSAKRNGYGNSTHHA